MNGIPHQRKRKLKGAETRPLHVVITKQTEEKIAELARLRGGIGRGALIEEVVELAWKHAQHVVQKPAG
jgi:hypothetical protein